MQMKVHWPSHGEYKPWVKNQWVVGWSGENDDFSFRVQLESGISNTFVTFVLGRPFWRTYVKYEIPNDVINGYCYLWTWERCAFVKKSLSRYKNIRISNNINALSSNISAYGSCKRPHENFLSSIQRPKSTTGSMGIYRKCWKLSTEESLRYMWLHDEIKPLQL